MTPDQEWPTQPREGVETKLLQCMELWDSIRVLGSGPLLEFDKRFPISRGRKVGWDDMTRIHDSSMGLGTLGSFLSPRTWDLIEGLSKAFFWGNYFIGPISCLVSWPFFSRTCLFGPKTIFLWFLGLSVSLWANHVKLHVKLLFYPWHQKQ
jgi:hypothetical protein